MLQLVCMFSIVYVRYSHAPAFAEILKNGLWLHGRSIHKHSSLIIIINKYKLFISYSLLMLNAISPLCLVINTIFVTTHDAFHNLFCNTNFVFSISILHKWVSFMLLLLFFVFVPLVDKARYNVYSVQR